MKRALQLALVTLSVQAGLLAAASADPQSALSGGAALSLAGSGAGKVVVSPDSKFGFGSAAKATLAENVVFHIARDSDEHSAGLISADRVEHALKDVLEQKGREDKDRDRDRDDHRKGEGTSKDEPGGQGKGDGEGNGNGNGHGNGKGDDDDDHHHHKPPQPSK